MRHLTRVAASVLAACIAVPVGGAVPNDSQSRRHVPPIKKEQAESAASKTPVYAFAELASEFIYTNFAFAPTFAT